MPRIHPIGVLVASAVLLGACVTAPSGTPEPTTTTTVPPEIAITSSDPASPSTSVSPRLIGYAPSGASTVRVFASADCSGSAVAFGTPAAFASPGLAVSVGLATSSLFSAVATGPGVLTACSAPFGYVNALTAPTGAEVEPNDGVLLANPIVVDVGTVADISGHLDGPGGSDLFTFHVDAGRSLRVETFDWTGLTCALTDTHVYLAPLDAGLGGNDDDGGVDLCSLLAPGVGVYGPNMVAVPGGDYLLNVQGSPLGGAYRVRVSVLT